MQHKLFRWFVFAMVMSMFSGCSSDSGSSSSSTAPVYEKIASFSGNMAPVRLNGKWGFIGLDGNLVIPAQYDEVQFFSDGLAAYEAAGRWRFLDAEGKQPFDRDFFRVGIFSEGLAAAKNHVRSSWGYINKSGKEVIPGRFESALPFANGLAPVENDGKWRYIREDGSEALVTPFYRAYEFTDEGLALVRPEKAGKYGYIGLDGNIKIPATYDMGFPFSDGLAAVRVGDKWGYIDTKGLFVIEPRYEHASVFSENMAAVMDENRFHYIDKAGQQAFPRSFDWAAPFSDGRALVMDNGTYWYINPSGIDLTIAQARQKTELVGDTQCQNYQSVLNMYQAGFVRFRIVNVDDSAWNISTKKTWTDGDLCIDGSTKFYEVLPGFPTYLDKAGTSLGYVNFLVNYQTGACLDSGNETKVFDMTLTKADDSSTVLTLSNTVKYKPDPQTGTPFWDFLKDGIDMIEGLVDIGTGHIWSGMYNWGSGLYGVISSGTANNEILDQPPGYYGTRFITQLEGQTSAGPLAPLDGSFCGGDEYTISDGSSVVVEIDAGRQAYMPGEVAVAIYRYDRFFALRAADRLNEWRNESSQYLGPPYNTVLKSVFANYTEVKDYDVCENTDGTQGYLEALSRFESHELFDFWDLADNFDSLCAELYNNTDTYCSYFAKKFSFSCTQ